MFFLLFLLDDRRIRIREDQKHMDPTDMDPQHRLKCTTAAWCILVIYALKNRHH
jgi:hypothetical protein